MTVVVEIGLGLGYQIDRTQNQAHRAGIDPLETGQAFVRSRARQHPLLALRRQSETTTRGCWFTDDRHDRRAELRRRKLASYGAGNERPAPKQVFDYLFLGSGLAGID